jgi:hypothetical protein
MILVLWPVILAFVFLSLGISSIVVYIQNPHFCGNASSFIPLNLWVWGTGLSYSIIGLVYATSLILRIIRYVDKTLCCDSCAFDFSASFAASLFAIPWTIIGAVISLGPGVGCIM